MKELTKLIQDQDWIGAKVWILENHERIEEIADCLLEDIDKKDKLSFERLIEIEKLNGRFEKPRPFSIDDYTIELTTYDGRKIDIVPCGSAEFKIDWDSSIVKPIID